MQQSPQPQYVPLVEVVRSGFAEGVHFGTAVGLTARGEIGYVRGGAEAPMLPRSSAKPFQAAAALRAGANLGPAQTAIAAGSHSGEPRHVETVTGMLADAGLDAGALRCPADWPLDRGERDRLLKEGGAPSSLLMNCSGKHAAMLAACVARGWSTEDYLEPGHPVQEAVRREVEEMCGEPVARTTVDGCGAPQLAVSLLGLARGLRAMTLAPAGSHEAAVLDAMRNRPEYVAGEGRTDTLLMRGLPGAVAKMGAEGVLVVAAPGGEVAAVKLSDGDPLFRARTLAALVALAALGADVSPVRDLAAAEVRGGGRRVGRLRPVADEALA
ncbi:asparaginase [Streptomonospora wellingtoniae]|uniref:Asparaginase n=1 Tax=Streptomonospora wellingtoniae TaxID=3075544 RepID=A0ABU2KSF6_9ACTN|nr:asparaginase [Streptomonospora sp. DSM 45055]MDT0302219.1 asparaginase [Streptomonospora sp. DSM 45055]